MSTKELPQYDSPLYDPCKKGDVDAVTQLIKEGAIVNVCNKEGHTPLHIAAVHNHLEVVDLLLKNGANPNTKDKNGNSLLHSLCNKKGMYRMIALMLRNGADVNALDPDGFLPLQWIAGSKDPDFDVFLLMYLSGIEHLSDIHTSTMLSRVGFSEVAGQEKALYDLLVSTIEFLSKKHLDLARKELSNFAPTWYSNISKIKTIDISHNYLKVFPTAVLQAPSVTSLDLSYNQITLLPEHIAFNMVNLQLLNMSHNLLDDIPADASELQELDVSDNPLASVPAVFKDDKSKLALYIKHAGKKEPWNQIKVMLVGHEGVGKTTFLRSLQGQQSPAAKKVNLSTNGVDIARVEIPLTRSPSQSKLSLRKEVSGIQRVPSDLKMSIPDSPPSGTMKRTPSDLKKSQEGMKRRDSVSCNVWDFGGQAVFHSTHRFFLTAAAIYVVVFNMADEKTQTRLQHWMQQIASIVDNHSNSMPVLIVGTHADKVTKLQQQEILDNIAKKYPIPRNRPCTGIQGHFAVSLKTKNDPGLMELKEKITELAMSHPKIGLGKVMVPSFLVLVKDKLEQKKQEMKYMRWTEYEQLVKEVTLTEAPTVEWTQLLQEMGILVWNNTPNLRDIVIIDPQWLADVLAGVVTMVNQEAVIRTGGVVTKSRLQSFMIHKIDPTIQPIIFGLLERFEIILHMRNYYSGIISALQEDETPVKGHKGKPAPSKEGDEKYFVPSLLLSYDPHRDIAHPAVQFWTRLNARGGFTMLKRRFTWNYYPANFFPRLLLRLMHMRMSLLGSWVDAAVIMSQDQGQYAFVYLFPRAGQFMLEISVMQEEYATPTSKSSVEHTRDSLISELAYAVTRLDRDMGENIPATHEVVVCQPTKRAEKTAATSPPNNEQVQVRDYNRLIRSSSMDSPRFSPELEEAIPFADCVKMTEKNESYITVKDTEVRVDDIVPDLSCCNIIHRSSLSNMEEIGKGGFGVVYKANMRNVTAIGDEANVIVAIKEMIRGQDEEATDKIYEFQHEMLIMSKIQHRNLVHLYGILKSPLSLVMEYIPCGDLHNLLLKKSSSLGFKWRLKMAIDIANGMSHLHKQTPPICHSDLRAPNIFVVSTNADDDVVGKVADFGLAQQVFPFSVTILDNLSETAPETWGDRGITKGAMYDERSDVFSYAVILWRLFATKSGLKSILETTPQQSDKSDILNSIEQMTDEEDDPYGHLRDEKGRGLGKWALRNKIREGARPFVHTALPSPLRKIIEDCWQFDPLARPFFPFIVQRLCDYYESIFGEDKYVVQAELSHAPVNPPVYTETLGEPSSPCVGNWEEPLGAKSQNWAVVSFIEVDGEIWAGTNTGAVLVFETKTGQFVHFISLQKSGRVSLLRAGRACVWASCESEKIYMIHAPTKYKIIELENEAQVICMALSHHHAGPTSPVVWVADTRGYVSLWDLTTIQKYCKFLVIPKVEPAPVVRSMSVLQEHVWMAVGGDIVVIESQALQKVWCKGNTRSRINDIAVVPTTQQAWTASKDGTVRVWSLHKERNRQTNQVHYDVQMIMALKNDTEIKFVQAVNRFSNTLLQKWHVCTGDFNGKLQLWSTESEKNPEEVPTPRTAHSHALQCGIDVGEDGLWCGSMNKEHPLLRYKSLRQSS